MTKRSLSLCSERQHAVNIVFLVPKTSIDRASLSNKLGTWLIHKEGRNVL